MKNEEFTATVLLLCFNGDMKRLERHFDVKTS